MELGGGVEEAWKEYGGCIRNSVVRSVDYGLQ